MTPEEARKEFNKFVSAKTSMRPVFVDVVNDALEKQVPKKPRSYQKSENEVGKIGYDFCAVCGAMATRKYCPECGQAIDWTEADK